MYYSLHFYPASSLQQAPGTALLWLQKLLYPSSWEPNCLCPWRRLWHSQSVHLSLVCGICMDSLISALLSDWHMSQWYQGKHYLDWLTLNHPLWEEVVTRPHPQSGSFLHWYLIARKKSVFSNGVPLRMSVILQGTLPTQE